MSRHGIPGPWVELVAVLVAPALAVALAAAVFALLPGCTSPDWPEVYRQAAAYRREVNAASDDVSGAAYGVVFACNVIGTRSSECDALTDAYNATREAVIVAHRAVDLYEDVGHGAQAVDAAIEKLRASSGALVSSVKAALEHARALVTGPDGADRNREGSGGSGEAGAPTEAGSGAPHPADAGGTAQ